MKSNEFKTDDLQSIAEIDRIIHEPARLMILAVLNAVDSADFLFLMKQTGLTRGNLSSHMSKLEEAGYLEIQKEFVDKIPRTLLRLTQQGKKAFKDYKEKLGGILQTLAK